MEYGELVKEAFAARERSYSPYSHFRVGAALLTKSGKIYTGCNVENASYGAANCAERTAFFKAVSEGDSDFSAIAIAGGDKGELCAPCGICRQVMAEFCKAEEFLILLCKNPKEYEIHTLAELLPFAFGKANLE